MKVGDTVRRRADPVHTGEVFKIRDRTSNREMSADVYWLPREEGGQRTLERRIPSKELEPATRWK